MFLCCLKSNECGKGEEELTSFSFFAFDANIYAVCENDLPCDAETQTGAFIAAVGSAEKFLKKCGDANPWEYRRPRP